MITGFSGSWGTVSTASKKTFGMATAYMSSWKAEGYNQNNYDFSYNTYSSGALKCPTYLTYRGGASNGGGTAWPRPATLSTFDDVLSVILERSIRI